MLLEKLYDEILNIVQESSSIKEKIEESVETSEELRQTPPQQPSINNDGQR